MLLRFPLLLLPSLYFYFLLTFLCYMWGMHLLCLSYIHILYHRVIWTLRGMTFRSWKLRERSVSFFNLMLMLKLFCCVISILTNFYLIFSLKIFVPITVAALLVLIPVNVSSRTLFFLKKELVVSDIDKLLISNVPPKSIRYNYVFLLF